MAIIITNIVKGIIGRWRRKKQKHGFSSITWLQEKLLKHQEDKEIKHVRFGNIIIFYKRPYEILHTYKEIFEQEIYKFLSTEKNPLIIDCGSNIGVSVLYFKNIYPDSTILSFEPDAENFKLLQKNITANNLQQVYAYQAAVWTHNGEVTFSSDGSESSQIGVNSSKNVVTVASQRLANILKEKKVDFLKIDIEGAELDVLKDCEPFLNNVQNFFIEYHGKTSETQKLHELITILKNHFMVYFKLAADNLHHPFIEKSTGKAFDVQLNIFCYKL